MKNRNPKPHTATASVGADSSLEASFSEIVGLIDKARQRARQAVNTELVGLLFSLISMSMFRDLSGTQWLISVETE